MLFGYDLNHLFSFPVRDREAVKYFLIGCAIYLAGFIIPIIPWLIVTGYSAILIRQVLNGDQPHLVPWDNWETLLKDGAILFGVRLIYTLPIFLLMVPLLFFLFTFPFIASSNDQITGIVSLVLALLSSMITILIMPLSLIIGLIAPASEVHVIANDNFITGFRVKEWWPIFKKNWGGFVVSLAIMYGLLMVISVVLQIMFLTLVLICLLPIFMPVVSMYITLIQYAAFAQAYKEGKDRLTLETQTLQSV